MIGQRHGIALFAIEDTAGQFTWRALGPGVVTVRCGDHSATFESDGSVGCHEISGLRPGTTYTATFDLDGRRITQIGFTTLDSPPGEELGRFATLSDVHLGREHFGIRKTIREYDVDVGHPTRCGRAAVSDLLTWGAERLVIKGDLVDRSTPHHWDLAADLLASVTIPMDVLPGNHEMAHGDGIARQHAQAVGLRMIDDVETVDLGGLRLVLMDSTTDNRDVGRWHHLEHDVATAAAEAAGPALVVVHHQPQPAPLPTYLPVGINSFSARRFVRTLVRANPATMGTSGHTHRHRRHLIEGIPWTEVGGPKDYPGTWAGYVVHEGGIRQVVRRIDAPDCFSWLERTRSAAGGAWGFWSPGSLEQRCFTHIWPNR